MSWKRRKQTHKRKFKTVYCVIVEGQTERWYFKLMNKHENSFIKIHPELQRKRKMKDIADYIKETLVDEGYDKIFWLIDMDAIQHNNQLCELNQAKKELKKIKKTEILINNPCLEFWYLLHFKNTKKEYFSCEKVIKEIKKYSELSNYKKSEKYYWNSSPDIYKRLKPYQGEAIKRAENLDKDQETEVKAQIYKIIKAVINF